jgi:CheY-like chemotaxis protein
MPEGQTPHELCDRDLTGKRILVVEDDPVVAVDYHFELGHLGAAEIIESSNRAALDYLACHSVDAAIVDYHLRDGCCLPVLDHLSAHHIPFVVISGDTFAMHDMPSDVSVLSKPLRPREVCQALGEQIWRVPTPDPPQ